LAGLADLADLAGLADLADLAGLAGLAGRPLKCFVLPNFPEKSSKKRTLQMLQKFFLQKKMLQKYFDRYRLI
jgi:hypothetical protein